MKTLNLCVATILFASLLAAGCSRPQTAAEQQAAKIDDAMSSSSAADITLPGTKPGIMPEGCYLRATIDGQKWEATEMTPDQMNLSLITVNGKNGKSSITFVIGNNRDNIGKPSNLSDMNQITYWGGEGFIVGAKTGQYTVTKIDEQFIEGTFDFTGEKDGKKVTATDGQFRIPGQKPSSSN